MCESSRIDEGISSKYNDDEYGKASFDKNDTRAMTIQTYVRYIGKISVS